MNQPVRSLTANEILELVFKYLAEVSSSQDYDEIIVTLANMGRALTSADRCTVWVVNEDGTKIWTKVAQGMDAIELPIDSGVVGTSIVSNERIIIDDVYTDNRFNQEIDQKTGYKTKSMMVIPMHDYDGNIIGAFQVINHLGETDRFDKRDMERLTLASTYAAETLVSAKLALEIEETQKEVVFTMGSIGESRSKETGNHVKRVAEYSRLLALAYGMSVEDSELLQQASPMHDIGKIAIPDNILKKPGRFDENERHIMNKHAELGYHMIKNSQRPLLKAAAIVAYEHHEKWDGTGYPNQTSGEDIHIFGRITALADVFDALGSDRVYKKAWSDERIFKLLKEERAKHFDPKLIDLFFENLDKILAVRDKFKDIFDEVNETSVEVKKIEILGAYGTKSKGYGTSSFRLNRNHVIDAGNLLDGLDVASVEIENIWVTHSHLDHIVDIAYILDNYFNLRSKSLNILGLPETLKSIQDDFLNDTVWPDFSKIKLVKSDEMAVTYTPIELDKEYEIGESEKIMAFKTDHTVPSCGYKFTKDDTAVLITADTYSLDNVIEKIESDNKITSIVVECSFPSAMDNLAKESKHLTPKLLFEKLEPLKRDDVRLFINHIKPSFLEVIKEEIDQYKGKWEPKILKDGDFINF
ncbi:HD domain-containing protein [Sulfurimonas aquatica]|uniref:HD domain-containing protein n=1 Tax=Sulfurimonas aquatica TaxID=2672570 RepID=A0A975GBV8_9BACT|nr:HD domain-containing phosphohydrolase [Sulfurimonas aquatica]QSZ40867.1 HD domain-containing protein [Sulfurimonas aquatica]